VNMSKLQIEIVDQVAVITLNDPSSLNALSMAMAIELKRIVEGLSSQSRAVLLTGAGRAFCAGANMTSEEAENFIASPDRDAGGPIETVFNPLVVAFHELTVPLVVAVNGVAAGFGCSMALQGDLIVAGEGAYFLQAFSRIGVCPDGGSSYLLPRAVGRARASEMVLLGEKVPARLALEWGLINRVVADAGLMANAFDLARILARGPASLGLTRRLMWQSVDSTWEAQLHNESLSQRDACRTEDYVEGVSAFNEKRAANFKGR
jgi:2-(1,2-epoxy-1,2-dihydrophenyl)acetyl-CoA isomerase